MFEECKFKNSWRNYQSEVLNEFGKHIKDKKIHVVAPPGSGKTVLGLEMVRRLNQNVLILAPTITIKNQWIDKFKNSFVPDGLNVDYISSDVYNLNKFNVVTYQALHFASNKKRIIEEDELNEEEVSIRVKTENIEYDLIQSLKDKNIKVIVLDEAHHLRDQWWKSLNGVVNSLDDIKIISLTATPPYDVEEGEWKRYEDICGPVDAEISVPELVATSDLCPHQDYVIFSKLTKQEEEKVKQIRGNIEVFLRDLSKNIDFVNLVKLNKVLNNWRQNEETILADVSYYSSMIIFLNSIGQVVDKKLVKFISNTSIIPNFNKEWAEVLLRNILFMHKDEFLEYEDVISKIKKELDVLGCIDKKNVYLKEIKKIKKIMASSISKLSSIVEITKKECSSMKDNLSMVILADYVRYDEIDVKLNEINKLGVIPIFRYIKSQNICNSIAVLTGKIKIIPKSLVNYVSQRLKDKNIDCSGIFRPFDDEYILINASKKIESIIVEIVTECVNLKKINILIGTVALLGEGWDAPEVNSLILASYVASYMLSNQMRGRAIRQNSKKSKIANIWHLASIVNYNTLNSTMSIENKYDLSELDSLKRRFNSFVGIGYYDNVIQNGIDRLELLNDQAYLAKNYNSVNEEMYKLALDRKKMASRWESILTLYGKDKLKMVDKLTGEFKLRKREFITLDFKRMLLFELLALFIKLVIVIFFGVGITKDNVAAGSTFLSIAPRYIYLYIVIFIYFLIKMLLHLNPLNYMKQIGHAILNTMYSLDKLSTNKNLVSVGVEKKKIGKDVFYKVYLKGATILENNLFTKCFEEVYSKVKDTRYCICIKGKKLTKDTYFNVPSIFDDDKNKANVFLNEWNKNVCKARLIYTRSKEGRIKLLKARKHSFNYNENFFNIKEIINDSFK